MTSFMNGSLGVAYEPCEYVRITTKTLQYIVKWFVMGGQGVKFPKNGHMWVCFKDNF